MALLSPACSILIGNACNWNKDNPVLREEKILVTNKIRYFYDDMIIRELDFNMSCQVMSGVSYRSCSKRYHILWTNFALYIEQKLFHNMFIMIIATRHIWICRNIQYLLTRYCVEVPDSLVVKCRVAAY